MLPESVPPTRMRPAVVPVLLAVRVPPVMEVLVLPETLIRPLLALSDPPPTVAEVPRRLMLPPSAESDPLEEVVPVLRRSTVPPVAARLAPELRVVELDWGVTLDPSSTPPITIRPFLMAVPLPELFTVRSALSIVVLVEELTVTNP